MFDFYSFLAALGSNALFLPFWMCLWGFNCGKVAEFGPHLRQRGHSIVEMVLTLNLEEKLSMKIGGVEEMQNFSDGLIQGI
ncbi:unnamed protein product [Linum tenue]|uniref:Uncharacterized protein n=1 Tax=Linum tenue TaxID=586396 RepID=A0AAV0HNJ0_9ROSI|nr:unnamed protein product [Linum tenue]